MAKRVLIIIAVGVLVLLGIFVPKKLISPNSNVKTPINPTPESVPETPQETKYFYPTSDYGDRIKYRWYGKQVTATDQVPYCGAPFSGLHTGDDLEATAAEQDVALPVYAVSDATVDSISYISGYGGLIVLSTNIEGQAYTVYYGHVSLPSSILKAGQTVKAGDFLANLGRGCTTETNGERKHLHFSIRNGTTADVRGYVQTSSELANWINPKDFLTQINAVAK